MRTRSASLNARWIAAGRSHRQHDHTWLAGIACILLAVLLYVLSVLVLGVSEYDEAFGWSAPIARAMSRTTVVDWAPGYSALR